MSLYEQNGVEITTHSMLKAFSECPNKAKYKYVERLRKKFATKKDKPLKRGTWFHALLEEYYVGRSWKAKHKELTAKFNQLFDEEQEALGDLPTELAQLMKSYLWHYGVDRNDPLHGWKVHDTELTLECPWPDSGNERIYRCRLDALVEDDFGLWIVDHKTHKSLPGTTFRLLDYASALYIWCARENGLDVQGFIWNYIRTKAPTKPKLVYAHTDNPRLSSRTIETDYPTFARAIKEYGLDPKPYHKQLVELKDHRWASGKLQRSSFFRREILEKDDEMLARVVAASMKTRDRMHEYDWEVAERTVGRTCEWCDFGKDLCPTELFGGNTRFIRKRMYQIGDPLDYYQDIKEHT